ncbi:GT2 family glycosyltransferase [Nitrosomonas sp. Nm84]|uniref:glycosyltransferase n=1 Tax=Nitrosomonas sp. Nm84 TaxID=200124 RepID=UPI000D76B7E3|nr:glycosyltransferase [Nitrosomonas sp. Nm84]PXW87643.1 GT2 family glycosyltransferase [Nitrosomonas sp. Nm84]
MSTLATSYAPLVTLVIRSMSRSTLNEALDSVAAQIYPNIEVIVVNAKGGNHADLAISCGRFPLRLINQEGDTIGRSAAVNTALEAARGDLLGFLDGDGMLLRPDHVMCLVDALRARPDAVAACARVHMMDSSGRLLRELAMPFDTISLYLGNFLPIHAVLFHRRAYMAGARFDEALELYEDWDFCLQVAQQGDFIVADTMAAITCIDEDHEFAITGDPELARATEHAVYAKWKTRMDDSIFHDLINRARAYPQLQALQAHANDLESQLKELQRLHADQRRLTEETVALFENSRSWRVTRPLRSASTLARLVQRAWCGFGLLDRGMQLRVLGWLLSGQIAPARRKLSLVLQEAAEASNHSALSATAAPLMYNTQPSFPALPTRIDVVIPVYNGFEFLESLFDSLERAASTPFRLLVCNDASTDERVQPWLEQRLQDFSGAILLHNENNLGFVGTVNRLFEKVTDDFVLLNSDVQVPPFWLERLFAVILENPQVASVTPFTNAGAICSFPKFFVDNLLPQGLGALEVDGVLARLKDAAAIEIPTGVGFCMAIRLEAAKRIGMFDPVFGRGYREENDWCQKARMLGYQHVLAPNLFVYHKHGGSFPSKERQVLADRNEVILRERYPGLFECYEDFIHRDPIRPLRDFLYLMVLARQASRPALVIIDNAIKGGAYAYSRELIANTLDAGQPVLHLLDDIYTGELRVEWMSPNERLTLNFSDYPAWGRVIAGIQPESILINNLYSYRRPMDFLHWLTQQSVINDVPVSIALHDFFMLCPSLFLIDSEKNYCGLPDSATCSRCFSHLPMDLPCGAESIAEWRAIWTKALAMAASIIAFSNSTRDLFMRIYPQYADKIVVRPHSMARFRHQVVSVDLDKPLHIGIVGSIGWQKGWNIVKQLCEEIDSRRLPFRITVIGEMVPDFSADCLKVTGRYERTALASAIAQSGANIFLFPSIWPETFSYVAHEIMVCGVPLCCFNLGAPAEAVTNYSTGLVLDDRASPAMLLEQMEGFRAQLLHQRSEGERRSAS